ncbi:MAG: DEAD/DEAH box helicase [Nanoarchaeota archaeon]|nr:DEAD/DEAH box helicase [Nanoarchaeota archaeon]
MEQFEKLGLCEHVLKVISAKKFTEPSEIQKKTIPLILEGKDVIAGSATGSGKTLAFGSGMIKNIVKGKGVQGLILTPTRELAEQVSCALGEFAYHRGLEITAVYGGVAMGNQVKKLTYADIVVATPGRLLDHMQHNSIDLSKVDYLVLDEADRMWDMGFKEDVGKIVQACPKNRQTLLFSATITRDLADFAGKYMKSPVEVQVENYVDASKLKQIYYDVRDDGKFSLLVHLLKYEDAHLVMIFCNTRRNVDFVVKNLELNGVNAQAIHGGMEQNKRTRVLKGFDTFSGHKNLSRGNAKVNTLADKSKLAGACYVLVCTDVAARGLDIQGVSHVYNYDLPKDHKDYIHRIGRTARAGAEGIAVNILASRDYDAFGNIQRHNTSLVIRRIDTPRFENIFVKFDSPRGGGFHGRAARGGRDSRGPRRDDFRGPRRSLGSSGPRRSSPDGRGREQGGDRNKRSSSSSRSGFRGGGRGIRQRRDRH